MMEWSKITPTSPIELPTSSIVNPRGRLIISLPPRHFVADRSQCNLLWGALRRFGDLLNRCSALFLFIVFLFIDRITTIGHGESQLGIQDEGSLFAGCTHP